MELLLMLLCCCTLAIGSIGVSGVRLKRQNAAARKVVSIENAPFLIVRGGGNFTGNERFEGFIPDLLGEVAAITQEEYEIYLTPDGKYGSLTRAGTWNGMIGEIISGNADLVAAPLTVSYSRSNVINFGPSFMATGIQLLHRKPRHSTFNMFDPFATSVWICIVAVFALNGLGLYLIQRFSNASIEGRNDTSELAKVADACWVLVKAFSFQGVRDASLGVSGRVLLAGWLGFSAVTVGLFLASLVAWYPAIVLGVRDAVPFTDSKTLLQSGVTFGCLNGGATKGFFRISSGTVYEKMFYRMESMRSYVRSLDEGVAKVRDGDFVFVGESQMLEYVANHEPCDLAVVGEQMTSQHFALATAKGSSLSERLELAVMRLKESGVLGRLRHKWWDGASMCPQSIQGEAAEMPVQVQLLRYLETGPVIIAALGLVGAALVTAGQALRAKKKSTGSAQKQAAELEDTPPADADAKQLELTAAAEVV